MVVAETERLIIRYLTIDDSVFIFKLYNSEPFIEFVGDKNIKSVEEAKKYLIDGPIKMYTQKGVGLYLVELKNEQIPLGICGLIKRDNLDDIDIGYGFLPDYCGFGYAYESAHAVLDYAKQTLNLKRVVAITTFDNISCIRLLSKLGLEYIGILDERFKSNEVNNDDSVENSCRRSMRLYAINF
ncbi:GNAT family N-acetyltransferase [Zooshikella harenae]|uniref:GNAT family N-acetyltransferase n=1 Tax=Zooshikella harenae TaxID=2827238 RepID=A0ABS5ZIC3_9GAMM|nr:GNAT family N-acetyltransferase [Zooshikella harenae]MBU2713608.1 GNAT family N-acetyltransferase [Zooshikella harenae]